MALLWEKKLHGTHYQVKSAGHSIRLYSNGVFHSQWNPNTPVNGQLWESLLLPAFFLDTSRPLRILLLGVGGGAVVNLLKQYCNVGQLIGIELDKVHLQVAKRWFKSQRSGVDYVHADAVEWVKRYRGEKFDLIIDDLFMSDQDGEVLRAVPADLAWITALSKHVKATGILAMNFESIRQASRAWRLHGRKRGLGYACLLTSKRNMNAISILSRRELSIREFKRALSQHKALDIRKRTCKLDFSIRSLRR